MSDLQNIFGEYTVDKLYEKYGEITSVDLENYYDYKFIVRIATEKYTLRVTVGGLHAGIYFYSPLMRDWQNHVNAKIIKIEVL